MLAAALALVLSGAQTAAAQYGREMRFQGMDRDDDGIITREEWNGSDRSFRRHDWNGDGVLSGDEVRPGARRDDRGVRDRDFYGDEAFDDWTVNGFTDLDHDGDNRISRAEWHFDLESFNRADSNGDGLLSRREFLRQQGAGTPSASDLFSRVDSDGDGTISRREWSGTDSTFDSLDRNRNGRLTRDELSGGAPEPSRTRAHQAGYERGLAEGRAAGREDRVRNQGWDLEGQRELEQADSGYEVWLGSRQDYQAGYREGFRLAYGEGWRSARR
jgi:Ca2+-binding EF-hand superfamily protein